MRHLLQHVLPVIALLALAGCGGPPTPTPSPPKPTPDLPVLEHEQAEALAFGDEAGDATVAFYLGQDCWYVRTPVPRTEPLVAAFYLDGWASSDPARPHVIDQVEMAHEYVGMMADDVDRVIALMSPDFRCHRLMLALEFSDIRRSVVR